MLHGPDHIHMAALRESEHLIKKSALQMLTVICALFQHVCIMRGISKPTSNSSWVITAVAALFAERVWHLCRICLFWLEAILKLLLVYALTNISFATVCSLELQCIYISAWLANRKAISSTGCDHSKSSGVDFHRGHPPPPPSHIKASLSGKSRPMSPRHFFPPLICVQNRWEERLTCEGLH